MSFRINPWTENLFIEVASAIGGADSPNPGRCLSLLKQEDEDAYNDFVNNSTYCGTPANCNVSVLAFDDGDVDGAGAGDGENDEWHFDAANVIALICRLEHGSAIVYGWTNLTFSGFAIKE
jgi:hypothetical protein